MLSVVLLLMSFGAFAQDPWQVSADIRQGMDYYGESVANGMIGMVSDVRPLRNSRVILGGVYDRTAKDNIDSYFDNIRFMDMTLKADGESLDSGVLTGYICYPAASLQPQELRIPFVVDKTNPEVTEEVTQEDGRTILPGMEVAL